MTADRDQHGLSADEITLALASNDEPRERLDPPVADDEASDRQQ